MKNNFLELEDKIVIVTGGVSGIGKAIVDGFLSAGAKVAVSDIQKEEPQCFKENDNVLYCSCDVSSEEEVKGMVKKTMAHFGKIDILINNAGINIPSLLIDTKEPGGVYELNTNVYDKVMNVNVRGVYLCAQIAGHEMIKGGGGVIINLSSECGLEGSEGQGIYAASKNAVNSFTRSWAKELGRHGIRVVGVAPGILEETGLRTLAYEEALAYTRNISVDTLRKGYENSSTTPLGRVGKLSEVANMVCFLASSQSAYVHGITVNIAGGKTRG